MSQINTLSTKGKICWITSIKQIIVPILKGNKLVYINKYQQIEEINVYYKGITK